RPPMRAKPAARRSVLPAVPVAVVPVAVVPVAAVPEVAVPEAAVPEVAVPEAAAMAEAARQAGARRRCCRADRRGHHCPSHRRNRRMRDTASARTAWGPEASLLFYLVRAHIVPPVRHSIAMNTGRSCGAKDPNEKGAPPR